jgi:hypothetical protein
MRERKFSIHQTVLILALFFLLGNNAHSQVDTSEYKVGDTWIYFMAHDDGYCDKNRVFKYKVIDLERIGAKVYSRVAALNANGAIVAKSIIPIFKKNGKVEFNFKGQSYLMYDFNLKVRDSFTFYTPINAREYAPSGHYIDTLMPLKSINNIVESIDTIESLEGKKFKRTHFDDQNRNQNCRATFKRNVVSTTVDGVGSARGLFSEPCGILTAIPCLGGLYQFISGTDTTTFYRLPVSTKEQDVIALEIYPNPVGNELNIKGDMNDKEYIIFSLDSKVVSKGRLVESIDVSRLQSGLYFIEVIDGNKRKYKSKFVKM